MAEDFATLKSMLWDQFRDACGAAKNTGANTDARAQSRIAVGTIGAALVNLEREQRESAADQSFKMPGK